MKKRPAIVIRESITKDLLFLPDNVKFVALGETGWRNGGGEIHPGREGSD